MTAPARFDPTPLIPAARAAMVKLFRFRHSLQAKTYAGPDPTYVVTLDWIGPASVSAMDLYAYLDRIGVGGDRRWSGAVFTAPRGLWWRIGFTANPRRHGSPTPLFALNETRAQALGL